MRLPPTLLSDVVRLREASLTLCEAFGQRARRQQRSQLDSEVLDVVFLIATKSVRIARHLEKGRDPSTYARDCAPNLLLLAELKSTLREQLRQLAPHLDAETQASTQGAFSDFECILNRLLELLDARFKRLLDSLVREGLAPSPFCRKPQGA